MWRGGPSRLEAPVRPEGGVRWPEGEPPWGYRLTHITTVLKDALRVGHTSRVQVTRWVGQGAVSPSTVSTSYMYPQWPTDANTPGPCSEHAQLRRARQSPRRPDVETRTDASRTKEGEDTVETCVDVSSLPVNFVFGKQTHQDKPPHTHTCIPTVVLPQSLLRLIATSEARWNQHETAQPQCRDASELRASNRCGSVGWTLDVARARDESSLASSGC